MAFNIPMEGDLLPAQSSIADEALSWLKENLIWSYLCTHTPYPKYMDANGDIFQENIQLPSVSSGRILPPIFTRDIKINVNPLRQRIWVKRGEQFSDMNDFCARHDSIGDLVSSYDSKCAREMLPNIHALPTPNNTFGSPLSTSIVDYADIFSSMLGFPEDTPNYAILHPRDFISIEDELEPVREIPYSSHEIAGHILPRCRGALKNWLFFENVHVPTQKVAHRPDGLAPVVKGGNQEGGHVITSNWEVSPNIKILNKGQLITFADVHEIQPRNMELTGRLKTFTVIEDVKTGDSHSKASEIAIPISPKIILSTTTTKNTSSSEVTSAAVFRNVSEGPVDNATLGFIGDSNTEYTQGAFFNSSCQKIVHARSRPFKFQPHKMATDQTTGVSICIVHSKSNHDTSEEQLLFQVLFGVKCVFPERGLRWIGPPVSS